VLTLAGTSSLTAFAATSSSYSVQPRDTFYNISVRQGVSLTSLEIANPQVTDVNSLYPGESIHMPSSTSILYSYTIQPEDTLFSLAVQKGISLTSIELANPQMQNYGDVWKGEIINLPTGTISTETATATKALSKPTSSAGVPAATKATAIINLAKSFIGTPYVWGGSTPQTGFDCSGFVQYVFNRDGISLPRVSHNQASVGFAVSQGALQPGDLLFFSDTDSYASLYANHVTHVGIYIGNGAMIESSSSNNNVGVIIVQHVFSNPYYNAHYYGARRVISARN